MMMLVGWGILAVPTGIVTAEMARQHGVLDESGRGAFPNTEPRARGATRALQCSRCGAMGHSDDASFCRCCGSALSV
jgi:voltage-gated potassium channel